ncbi:MAG: holo-ACP synthase [Robiginitomaculum sp.]
MIVGIGTDICDIRRIESLLDKFGDRFRKKTFTKGEIAYAQSKPGEGATLAKRFAAKEAAAKALAGKNTGALFWHDVEVINQPSGKPEIKLHGRAKKRIGGNRYEIHLSLTDDYPYAQAFVIVEAR